MDVVTFAPMSHKWLFVELHLHISCHAAYCRSGLAGWRGLGSSSCFAEFVLHEILLCHAAVNTSRW